MSIIFFFLGNVILNTAGNVLMKIGLTRIEDLNFFSLQNILKNVVLNAPLVIGVFSYGASLVFYLFVLQKVNLSIAYPIVVGCTMILVTIVSRLIFHEAISLIQISGSVVILIGIMLVARS